MSFDEDEYYVISVAVGRSRRYHAFMRDFYQRIADWILAAQALTGTAAFVALLPQEPNTLIATLLTAVVAAASVLDLVFRFGKKAELHDSLCRQFTTLAADMATWPKNNESLKQAAAARIRLEVDEPTVRRLIDLRAHNEECSARGTPMDRLIPLTRWQESWLGYLFTFGESEIRKRMHERDNQSSSSAKEAAGVPDSPVGPA